MKKKAEKVKQSEELKSQLATVSTVILSTFQGITVEQDTKLRRSVEAAGGHYLVVKNTVAERAGAGTLQGALLPSRPQPDAGAHDARRDSPRGGRMDEGV